MVTSFEEKSAWVQLLGLGVVMGGYLAISANKMAQGVTTIGTYVPIFVGAIVLLIIVQIIGHILAAMTGPAEPRDERDRLISWRSEANASWVLGLGAFGAITALILNATPVWTAHILIAALYASEMLKLALQAVYYRTAF